MPQESSLSSEEIVAAYLRLLRSPIVAPALSAIPLSTTLPLHDASRPCALLLSPHPDDECLTGLLPLRLLREQNWQIINIAMTLGSSLVRRAGRKHELAKACAILGFACALPEEDGFSNVNEATREGNPAFWGQMVSRLRAMIAQIQPQLIIMPHAADYNTTHMGTHGLGFDAMARLGREFTCAVALTEYWQPMDEPNAMIGASEKDAAALLLALSCHAGEVARNPFDRHFPAHLIDNVRRGSERIRGQGAAGARMDFASLYKLGIWLNGKFVPSALKRLVGEGEDIGTLFA